MSEAKAACERAIKDEAPKARDLILNRIFFLDKDYLTAVLTGDYPNDFDNKIVDFNWDGFKINSAITAHF